MSGSRLIIDGGFMDSVRRAFCLLLVSLTAACSSAPPDKHGWELLGKRDVDFHVDHDAIEVGKSEGHFRVLRFVVHGGSIEMYEVKVLLGDGDSFRLPNRLILDPGEGRTVDLPGDRRGVRRVEFVYRSLKTGGRRATVSLYGR
jgi:hypothetical protein